LTGVASFYSIYPNKNFIEQLIISRISAIRTTRASLFGNINRLIRYEWVERCKPSYKTNIGDFFMPITIASIMNLMGPDMMVILLIVLLLFGAKKLPELARGMGRAVKEFGAARDEVERELSQSGSNGVAPSKLLGAKSELPSAR